MNFSNIQMGVLALIALLTSSAQISAAIKTGSCGTNVTYEFNTTTGALTISGSGAINDDAFNDDDDIKSVEIKKGVTSIGEKAFYYCKGLTSIEIPNSVTSIGEKAFSYCRDLTSIEIPNSVTSIGNDAFLGCSGLTSIEIPNSVTSIGKDAFYDCSGLTSIEIPNSVTSIGNYAFQGCSGLTSIEIPNSVTSIGRGAFIGCSGLTSIIVDKDNTKYDSRNGCNAIIETATNTLIAGCKNTTIPNSVTSIGNWAFSYCSGLTSIEIPNSVTSIGNEAFYYCKGLTSIEIPNSVTSIGYSAFYSCSGLTSIEISNSVTSIGHDAFRGCSGLTSIEIPNSVTSIGDYAFSHCSGLTSIIVNVDKPIAINSNVFWFVDKAKITLYVPKGAAEDYKKADVWKEFGKIIEMAKVTLLVNDEDFGTIDGNPNVIKGEKATFTAMPNDGYHFVRWSDGNTDAVHEVTVADDIELTALFEKDIPTAIKAVEAESSKTIKTIKDGQIVIIRNGVMYDMQGRKL